MKPIITILLYGTSAVLAVYYAYLIATTGKNIYWVYLGSFIILATIFAILSVGYLIADTAL